MFVKAKLKDNVLKIDLPLRKPKVSGSGKSIVIATTMGPASTGTEYKGQEVLLVANAFVRNSEHERGKTLRSPKQKRSTSKAPEAR